MADDPHRRFIAARRARFVAAALAGLGGCGEQAPVRAPTAVAIAPAAHDASASLDSIYEGPRETADAGEVAAFDSDGDGVPDDIDKCPTVPGSPHFDGCPPMPCLSIVAPQAVSAVLSFADRVATLTPQMRADLDRIARLLSGDPNLTVSVFGHTDATEPDALAKTRADAVSAYLQKNGVHASRITTSTLGKTIPLATNTTDAGRAKNRRVEVRVQ